MKIIGVMSMSEMPILISHFILQEIHKMLDGLEEQMASEEHGDEKMNIDISSDNYDYKKNYFYFFLGCFSYDFLVYPK